MGTLFIISTPIGNIEDISIRAIKTLFSVDSILCEDTRVTGLLLNTLSHRFTEYNPDFPFSETRPKLIRYDNTNELSLVPEIIDYLEQDKKIALVTDAGTPLISDPGFRIVQELRKRRMPIIFIPGPSAVVAALVASGLPSNQWTFLGYLPEKQTHALKLLNEIKDNHRPCTYIIYSAPHKLLQNLESIASVFSYHFPVSIERELTKRFEESWEGTIEEAIQKFSAPKGEFVILFTLTEGKLH